MPARRAAGALHRKTGPRTARSGHATRLEIRLGRPETSIPTAVNSDASGRIRMTNLLGSPAIGEYANRVGIHVADKSVSLRQDNPRPKSGLSARKRAIDQLAPEQAGIVEGAGGHCKRTDPAPAAATSSDQRQKKGSGVVSCAAPFSAMRGVGPRNDSRPLFPNRKGVGSRFLRGPVFRNAGCWSKKRLPTPFLFARHAAWGASAP